MQDFQGREIRAGDVLAYAVKKGSHAARLEQRFVREVHANHVEVQIGPDPVFDRRQIGRLYNTRHTCTIIS